MLITLSDLARIKSGEISLVFRTWASPRVKVGSQIKTPLGLVEILSIEETQLDMLTAEEALQAGYASLTELTAEAAKRPDGQLYRIGVRYAGADPRLALRAETDIPEEEWRKLKKKLQRFDQGKHGPWVERVMQAIQAHPATGSKRLAAELAVEQAWLKPQVRKLKNLGLTISLEVGYQLSPRGEVVLKRWKNES
ncbi:MAG: ASCH domain-containing protein [Bacteroidota bacterium]